MNNENFIFKMCERAKFMGQAQAYDFALFLIEMYGNDLERVKSKLQVKMKEANERGKQCLL